MREIQITIKLTDKEIDFLKQLTLNNDVDFLKNLILNNNNEFEWEIDDYDMWNKLLSYGIVNEITLHYKRYKLLTDMGKQIKNLLENE